MQASGLPDPSDPSRPVPPRRPTCLGVLETTLETNMGSYTTMGSTGAMSLHKAYHKARTRAGGTVAGESTEQCSAAALDAFTEDAWRFCRHVPCALLDHTGSVHGTAWALMAAEGFVKGFVKGFVRRGAGIADAVAPNVRVYSSRRHSSLGRLLSSSDDTEAKAEAKISRRAFSVLERELMDLAHRVKDERTDEPGSTSPPREHEEGGTGEEKLKEPLPEALPEAQAGHEFAPASRGRLLVGAAPQATSADLEASKRPVTRPGRSRALWLSALSMPCADAVSRDVVQRFVATHAAPWLHVLVNIFDGETDQSRSECERPLVAAGALRVSYVSGFKPVFWLQALTPERTAGYDLLWLVDCDLRVSPHLFSLAQVEHWMEVSGASIAQPSVLPASKHGRGGRGALTRSGFSSDCIVHTMPYIEQMTPVLRREIWVLVWSALQGVPAARLSSDSGIETLWCGLAALHFPKWPACVALAHQSVIHLNTHTIHRFDKQEREHYFNVHVNLMSYLQANFAPAMRAALRCPGAPCRKAENANLKLFPSLQRVAVAGGARANATECWGV